MLYSRRKIIACGGVRDKGLSLQHLFVDSMAFLSLVIRRKIMSVSYVIYPTGTKCMYVHTCI